MKNNRFKTLPQILAVPLTLALTAAWVPAAHAACLSDLDAAAMVANYMAKTPAATPEGLSREDGECSRTKFNKFLAQQIGATQVGYKAGLTNPAVQKRFNASAPVWGQLYAPMLLKDGATVDAKFGARPLFEADMLVRVSGAGINQARTPEDVLKNIDQVIPFIELPDLVVMAPPKLNGAAIAAINVGARLGVMGAPMAVQRTAAFSDALRDMVVVVKGDGAELDKGKGSDVLEHPLNAVVWLVQDLGSQGVALKKGDLISLGSFSKLMPPKPGLNVEVEYQGLPGNPVVKVSFR
ncbi:fumarylacetoacetate hydrolase [Hydrogenophaga sp. PAMC20947]|uniref:2-keto-4-pentenoate hydratase n=1 Tax=Hydrogenophaga sp. PAMC20947 TaxID=2565558 RepID=UPI00109DA098|nr:fumarylacetoacetate hydrolase [Hydrogenophaga sp. PAMC20947]QCB47646.1 fumarylacetoacetate hydrolase [Hydrogenophaga sp. PAMC20947]